MNTLVKEVEPPVDTVPETNLSALLSWVVDLVHPVGAEVPNSMAVVDGALRELPPVYPDIVLFRVVIVELADVWALSHESLVAAKLVLIAAMAVLSGSPSFVLILAQVIVLVDPLEPSSVGGVAL